MCRNGHACCLQYILLHLFGYGLGMDELKRFRQLGSHTPGHPEANHGIPGVEVTTGPLGQGTISLIFLTISNTKDLQMLLDWQLHKLIPLLSTINLDLMSSVLPRTHIPLVN